MLQASSALRGGSSNHNGRIFSRNIGPNRTRATLRPFTNVLSAFRKKQENGQQHSPSSPARQKRRSKTALQVVAEIPSNDDKADVDLSKLGHDRLGDVLYKKIGESVNSITGKNKKNEPYEFGDLTKWVDRQARTRVGKLSLLSSKKNETDLSQTEQRNVNDHPFQKLYSKFGKRVNSITGKNKKDPYEFGDLTKWLVAESSRSEVKRDKRRHHNNNMEEEDGEEEQVSEYQKSDFISVAFGVFPYLRSILLVNSIRLVVKFGIERPVLTRLPSSILMELVHLILDGNYRPQILRVVATELDKRFKEAICGDEDYQFGDLTKKALFKFTGKEQYKFGDITKELLERAHASEDATAKYMDQVQTELHVLEDNVRSLSVGSKSSRSIRIPALRRWFQK
jgi:hypothetical protein